MNGHASDFARFEPSGSGMSSNDCSDAELMKVKEVISQVNNSEPVAPSLCVYNVSNAYNGLSAAKINNDAKLLACGFEDSVIKLWQLTQPLKNKGIFAKNREGSSSSHRILQSQSILACDSSRVEEAIENPQEEKDEDDDTIRNGRRNNGGGEMLVLRGHSGPVYDMAFTHNSSHLLSASEDTSVRLWDINKGETVCIYCGHHYPVSCISVAPKTLYFATGSYDTSGRLWTTECLNPLRTFCGHKKGVDCVAFHPNCSYVATGSSDKSVRMWQINDGAVARIFLHHQTAVNTLAFSPDGK